MHTQLQNKTNQSTSTLVINQQAVSLQHILHQFRQTGKLNDILTEILSCYILEQELNRENFEIDDSSLEEEIARYRKQNNLIENTYFQEWLLDNGLNFHTFREHVRFTAKLNAFKTKLAAPKLLETFIEQKLHFDQAVLLHIMVKTQELAEELKLQLEEGEKFEAFVQEYSCSDDAVVNGMMGVLSRAEIQAIFGIDAYQAKVGDLIGPIQLENDWHLLRVDKLLPATFDEAVIPFLEDHILEQWLANQIRMLDVEVCLSN
jgi:parvulin-like peptidyl-prolyl isomerase